MNGKVGSITMNNGATIVNTGANLLTIDEATTAFTGDLSLNKRLFVNGDVSFNQKLSVDGDALINGLTVGKGPNNLTYNTGVGVGVFNALTTGNNNVAIGYQSLYKEQTNGKNVAVGVQALYYNLNTNNTAIGHLALAYNTWGWGNTSVGYLSGDSNTTGDGNTYLGYMADANGTDLSFSTAIGYQSTITKSNQIVLGRSGSPPEVYIPGNVGIGTTTPTSSLHIHKSEDSTLSISSDNGEKSYLRVSEYYNGFNNTGGFIMFDGYYNKFHIGTTNANGDITQMTMLRDSNKIGIGTTSPQSTLDVEGNLAVGAGYSGANPAPDDGMIVQGRVGIGTTSPLSKLDVEGNLAVGANYSGSTAAPTDGMIVQGRVGIGTTSPISVLNIDTAGTGWDGLRITDSGTINTELGRDYQNGSGYLRLKNAGDGDSGIFLSGKTNTDSYINNGGKLGIGTTSPQSKLDVEGNLAVGANYSGSTAAPTDGMIVEGNVGIGTTSPGKKLDVNGDALINGHTIGRGNYSEPTNLAIGYQALNSSIDGLKYNTAIGYQSLYNANAVGSTGGVGNNNGVGYQTLLNNTSGYCNTAIGNQALYTNTSGHSNIALGQWSLYYNNGDKNVAVGRDALKQNTSGYSNVANGYEALRNTNSGFCNVAIGDSAGNYNMSGDYNTYLGYNTDTTSTGFNNSTALGTDALITKSDQIVLGKSSSPPEVYIPGNVGIGTTSPSAPLEVNGSVQEFSYANTYQYVFIETVTENIRLDLAEIEIFDTSNNKISQNGNWTLNTSTGEMTASNVEFYYSESYDNHTSSNWKASHVLDGNIPTGDTTSQQGIIGHTTATRSYQTEIFDSGTDTDGDDIPYCVFKFNEPKEIGKIIIYDRRYASDSAGSGNHNIYLAHADDISVTTRPNNWETNSDYVAYTTPTMPRISGSNYKSILHSTTSGSGARTGTASGVSWVGTSPQLSKTYDFSDLSTFTMNTIGTGGIFSGSAIFSHYIKAQEYFVPSDERIKKNIVDVQDDSALQKVRTLKPKTYNYRDTQNRTNNTMYGFISQDVNEVLPEAVQTNGTEIIPNIYEQASVSGANSDILTFSNFSTVNLERYTNSNEPFKKLGLKNDKSVEANIVEVINAHSIKIDVSMAEYSSNGIFVFGQEVNNFMNLQKSYLWTVATAALQEVDRQLQSEKITMQSHDAMIQNIQQEVNRATNNDDPRTQTNCADANTSSALDTLRLLKPKTFEYVDTINNTEQTVYGFDSNEIKQVVPYAAQTSKIQKIPNMYQKASVLGKKIIFTSFNVVNLAKDASNHLYPRIIVLDANDQEHEVKIVQLVNSYTIETDVELQSFVREDSLVANCVFIYGQIVENFETLSKDYIWTISTAALQEVDKQVQDEKNKQIELSNKVDTLETKLEQYIEIMNSLLTNME